MKDSFLFFILLIIAPISNADPNGCGTGWNTYLVPDKLRITGCDFKESCNEHDVCYSKCDQIEGNEQSSECVYKKCLPTGSLSGSVICESVEFRKHKIASNNRRAKCDADFMVNIVNYNPGNSKCTFYSALYPFFVRIFGNKSFLGVDNLGSSFTDEEKDAYINSLNDMLESWTPEQLEYYSEQLKSSNPPVDLSKPIKFNPSKGLYN